MLVSVRQKEGKQQGASVRRRRAAALPVNLVSRQGYSAGGSITLYNRAGYSFFSEKLFAWLQSYKLWILAVQEFTQNSEPFVRNPLWAQELPASNK